MAPSLERIGAHTELKCDADKFFDVWVRKPYLVAKMCPNKITKVELREGMNWQVIGAAMTWTYVFSEIGENASVKIRTEELDEKNRFVRYSAEDGLVMKKFYKTLNTNIQATPKGSGGCIVEWNCEYEKIHNDVPEPNMYLDFMMGVIDDVDAYLCKNNPC